MNAFKLLTTALLIGLAPNADAMPSLYGKCQDVQLSEPPQSAGYYLSEDCSTAYILPPQTGSLQINQYSSTGEIAQTCQSLASIEGSHTHFLRTEETLNRLMSRNAERIDTIEELLEMGLYPVGQTEDDLISEILTLADSSEEFRGRVMNGHRDYVSRLEHYAGREGGRGTFVLSSGHSDLIDQFKKLNQSQEMTFRPMPLSQSFLSILEAHFNSEQSRTEMSAVMELIVPGAPALLSSISSLIDAKKDFADTVAKGSGVTIFGAALSGRIRFSQMGACAIERAVASKNTFAMNELNADIAANAYYEYQVQVKRNHSITFNMRELVRIFHEQTRKGGLFSRKTLNSVADTRRSSSWIEFHAESQDQRFEYTDEYIVEVKKEFIERALRQVVAIQSGGGLSALALIDPKGATGSDVLANELDDCANLYCKIGASGFRVLSSIFGSRDAVSQLEKKFEGQNSEIVTEKKSVTQVGSMTFL